MDQVMVSVRDSAVGAFMRPFFAPSTAAAVRSFGDEVNRQGSEMNQHPEDYELYYLGDFDEQIGMVAVKEMPELVVRAKDMLKGA